MELPTFVDLEHDKELRKAYVKVQDSEVAEQRAMWGMNSSQKSL